MLHRSAACSMENHFPLYPFLELGPSYLHLMSAMMFRKKLKCIPGPIFSDSSVAFGARPAQLLSSSTCIFYSLHTEEEPILGTKKCDPSNFLPSISVDFQTGLRLPMYNLFFPKSLALCNVPSHWWMTCLASGHLQFERAVLSLQPPTWLLLLSMGQICQSWFVISCSCPAVTEVWVCWESDLNAGCC